MLLIFVSSIIYTLLGTGSIDFSLGEILVGKRGKEKEHEDTCEDKRLFKKPKGQAARCFGNQFYYFIFFPKLS